MGEKHPRNTFLITAWMRDLSPLNPEIRFQKSGCGPATFVIPKMSENSPLPVLSVDVVGFSGVIDTLLLKVTHSDFTSHDIHFSPCCAIPRSSAVWLNMLCITYSVRLHVRYVRSLSKRLNVVLNVLPPGDRIIRLFSHQTPLQNNTEVITTVTRPVTATLLQPSFRGVWKLRHFNQYLIMSSKHIRYLTHT